MKVGACVHIYNFKMRLQRERLGISQIELAKMSGVDIGSIQAIERLELVTGKTISVPEKLQLVANALEMDFYELFPEDYLEMLQRKIFPKQRAPIIWAMEVSLESLPPSEAALQLPAPDKIIEVESLKSEINDQVSTLNPREQRVIKLRFGFEDYPKTLEEIGDLFGCSPSWIRQIEAKALRKLRNPRRSKKLKYYLHTD